MRKRKTYDVWRIYVNYGQGWEHECTELTRKDARQVCKEYRHNAPEYPVKSKAGREPIQEA